MYVCFIVRAREKVSSYCLLYYPIPIAKNAPKYLIFTKIFRGLRPLAPLPGAPPLDPAGGYAPRPPKGSLIRAPIFFSNLRPCNQRRAFIGIYYWVLPKTEVKICILSEARMQNRPHTRPALGLNNPLDGPACLM